MSRKRQAANLSISANLSKDVLVRRLESMSELLVEGKMEHDLAKKLATDLLTKGLMTHRDAHVKVLTAQCIAEFLVYFAPRVPFGPQQQMRVLQFFASQLRGMKKPTGVYYLQYFSLLEIIAANKLFCLAVELRSGDLVYSLFKGFFDAISEAHSDKVFSDMADVMSSLINTGIELPVKMFDLIFEQILPYARRRNKAAAKLSAAVISQSASQLQLSIHHYFNILLDESKTESELQAEAFSLLESLAEVDPSVLTGAIPHLHHLLKIEAQDTRQQATELCGKILGKKPVFGMDFKTIRAEFLARCTDDVSPEVRATGVQALSTFALNDTKKKCLEETMRVLRAALMDVDDRVRLTAVNAVLALCQHAPETLPLSFLKHFSERKRDKKHAIRSATVTALVYFFVHRAKAAYSSFLETQENAAEDAGNDNDEADVNDFVIPPVAREVASQIIASFGTSDRDLWVKVHKLLQDVAIPASLETHERAFRFALLLNADQATLDLFLPTFFRFNFIVRDHVKTLMDLFASSDDEPTDGGAAARSPALQRSATQIAGLLGGSPHHTIEHIFAMSSEDFHSDRETLAALASEACFLTAPEIRDLQRKLMTKHANATDSHMRFLVALAAMAAPAYYDPDLLRELITMHVEDSPIVRNSGVLAFMQQLAKKYPNRVHDMNSSLFELLSVQSGIEKRTALLGMKILNTPMVLRRDQRKTKKTIKQVREFALGSDIALAKEAVKMAGVLFSDGDMFALITDLLDRVSIENFNANAERGRGGQAVVLAAIKSLGYASLVRPDVFEEIDADFTKFMVAGILTKTFDTALPASGDRDDDDDDEEEEEEDDDDDDAAEWSESPSFAAQVKVLGLKYIVRRLVGIANDFDQTTAELDQLRGNAPTSASKGQRGEGDDEANDDDEMSDNEDEDVSELKGLLKLKEKKLNKAVQSSIGLFTACLQGGGNLSQGKLPPLVERSRMRLGAACALLKLAEDVRFHPFIKLGVFELLSAVMQDSCMEVRKGFGAKLFKGLKQSTIKLPMYYMSMFVLSAIDPDRSCVEQSQKFLSITVKHARSMASRGTADKSVYLPEYVLPYVVHLLASHDDFVIDDQGLHTTQEYLDFFFDAVCTKGEEGYAFLKTMLECIKLSESKVEEEKKNAVCDVATLIINHKSEQPGWILRKYPGDVAVPSELFGIPTPESRALARVATLPASFQLHTHTKARATSARGRRSANTSSAASGATPRKGRTPRKSRTPRKKPSRSPSPEVPTRRNPSRGAKSSIRSMRDLDDDEIDEQSFIDHEAQARSQARKNAEGAESGEGAEEQPVSADSGSEDENASASSESEHEEEQREAEEEEDEEEEEKDDEPVRKGKRRSPRTGRSARKVLKEGKQGHEERQEQENTSPAGRTSRRRRRNVAQ